MAKGKRILELKIRTWASTDEPDTYIARIGKLPIRFTGPSPMQAHQAADDWRRAEVKKLRDAEAKRAAKSATRKAGSSPLPKPDTSTTAERQTA